MEENNFSYKWKKLFATKRFGKKSGNVTLKPLEQQELLNGSENEFGTVQEINVENSETTDTKRIVRCKDPMVCLRGCYVHDQTCKHPIYEGEF